MEQKDFIELADKNPEQAYQEVENMSAADLMALRENFAKTDNEARNEEFKFADEIIDDVWLDKIRSLSSRVEALSAGELETLETLLSNMTASSQIENLRAIRDNIAKRKETLDEEAKPTPEQAEENTADEPRDSEKTVDEKADEKQAEEQETKTTETESVEMTEENINKACEERYGIDEAHLQAPEIIERNINAFSQGGYAVFKPDAELLKTEAFQDVAGLFSQLEITNDKDKAVKDQSEDIALLMEQVRNETEMYLCNTSAEPLTPEKFEEEYATRLKMAVVEVLTADLALKENVSKDDERYKEIEEKARQLYEDLRDGKPCSIRGSSLASWHGYRQGSVEYAANQIGLKSGYERIGETFASSVKSLDAKLEAKYKGVYKTAKKLTKTALRAGGWSAAYGIGTALGPAGLAVVAGARVCVSGWQMVKAYKQQKKEAEQKGEKYGFKEWIKQPTTWLQIAGSAVTTLGAGIGIAGAGGNTLMFDMTNNQARMVAGAALAGTSASYSVVQAVKQTQGPWYKKAWAGTKTLGMAAAGYVVGMVTGREVSEFMAEHNVLPQQPDLTNNESQHQHNTSLDGKQPVWAQDPNAPQQTDDSEIHVPYTKEGWEAEQAQIELHDQVTNLNDQQQHDIKMLFARDPREANEILGGKWMSSDALQKAWDDGTITDVQKAELLDFASQRFDAAGHFQDVEGHTSALDMETEAKVWTAEHTPHANEPAADMVPGSENTAGENGVTGQEPLVPVMNPETYINNYHDNIAKAEVTHTDSGMSVFMGEKEFALELADKNLTGFEQREDGTVMLTRMVGGHEQKIAVDGAQIVFDKDGSFTQEQIDTLNKLYAEHPENPTNPMETVKSIHDQIEGHASDLAKEQATEMPTGEQTDDKGSAQTIPEANEEKDGHDAVINHDANNQAAEQPQEQSRNENTQQTEQPQEQSHNENTQQTEQQQDGDSSKQIVQDCENSTINSQSQMRMETAGRGAMNVTKTVSLDDGVHNMSETASVRIETSSVGDSWIDKHGNPHMDGLEYPKYTDMYSKELQALGSVAADEQIYQNLQAQAANGETLNDVQKTFMELHEQNFESGHFVRNEDGSIRETTIVERIKEPEVKVEHTTEKYKDWDGVKHKEDHDYLRIKGVDSDGNKINAVIDEHGKYQELKVNGVKQECVGKPFREGLYEHFKESVDKSSANTAQNTDAGKIAALRGLNNDSRSVESVTASRVDVNTMKNFGNDRMS